jgi:hypothetical protein
MTTKVTAKAQEDFLNAALGEIGAEALLKAVAKEPNLIEALLPRTVLSWLSFNTEYMGPVLGSSDSYVDFKKNEQGYCGNVQSQHANYTFEDADIYHLAAAISVSLGVESTKIDTDVRDLIIAKLGKSIDYLVKTQLGLKSPKAMSPQKMTTHGNFHVQHSGAPDKPYSVIHTATNMPVQHGISTLRDAGEIANWHQSKRAMPAMPVAKVEGAGLAAKPQNAVPPVAPIASVKPPTSGMAKKPKTPNLSITKAQSEIICSVCEGNQFKDNKFKGCVCFNDLAKSIKTIAYSDGYVLEFYDNVDSITLMKLFGEVNG